MPYGFGHPISVHQVSILHDRISLLKFLHNLNIFKVKQHQISLPIISGWWFQLLQKIFDSWDHHSQYRDKYKMFQTTIQISSGYYSNVQPISSVHGLVAKIEVPMNLEKSAVSDWSVQFFRGPKKWWEFPVSRRPVQPGQPLSCENSTSSSAIMRAAE